MVSFFVISSSETVLSFTVSEYEVGQIADKTIIADVSLPPDARHPVSVEAGEKIVRKGFPVTEIGLAKLEKLFDDAVEEAPEHLAKLYVLSHEEGTLGSRWERTYNG